MNKAYDGTTRGMILDTGHGTLRDGPGWRSIVYFKGCNFRCAWCGSPDTWSHAPELLFYPERVKYAQSLAAACERGALRIRDNELVLDRVPCRGCAAFPCAVRCADGSLEVSGRMVTVDEIIGEIIPFKRAHPHYGVTLSGGEATLQWDFYMELLKACRAHDLHSAVETNGSNPRLPESFAFLDLVICDLKHIDPEAHLRWTGHDITPVLDNIRDAAAAERTGLRVRIPLIPGINDGGVIDRMIGFLLTIERRFEVEVLGYHKLGAYKWKAIGKHNPMDDIQTPSKQAIATVEDKIKRAGLCIISS